MTNKEIIQYAVVTVLGILTLGGIMCVADMNTERTISYRSYLNGRFIHATGTYGKWFKHDMELVRVNNKWYGKPALLFFC